MAKVRTPRSAWVDAALQALAAGGPDVMRVEALAVGLGVSKRGFYWHFTDRQALLEEMLDTLWVPKIHRRWSERFADRRLAGVSRLREILAASPPRRFS